MIIGIMLQSHDEAMGGIGIYTEEIVRALLQVESGDRFLLMFPGFGSAGKHKDEFHNRRNVTVVETGSHGCQPYSIRAGCSHGYHAC